jgi:hypothetical protein
MIKRETIDRHLIDLAEKVRFLRSCQKYSQKDFEVFDRKPKNR